MVNFSLNFAEIILKLAAKKEHSDTTTTYGEATDTKYGHVQKTSTISNNSTKAVTSGAVYSHTTTPATTSVLGHVKVDSSLSNSSSNPIQNKVINSSITNLTNNLSTANGKITQAEGNISTLTNRVNTLQTSVNGIDFVNPKNLPSGVNNLDGLVAPGYFVFNKTSSPLTISYGGREIPYNNGLINNKVQGNRLIQQVYTTKATTTNGTTTYRLTGSIYQRVVVVENGQITSRPSEWNWECIHVNHEDVAPYSATLSSTAIKKVTIDESTAGFTITWSQTGNEDWSYEVQKDLYEYADVCTFSPVLPIKGAYIFSNLIGKIDVKITSEKMQVRSTLPKGNKVYDVNASYFVPRQY